MTGAQGGGPREFRPPVTFWPVVIGSVVVSVIVWLAVFKQAMLVPFSHDEHQFVAAGRLLAGGSLPYRDFPSNHMPYLTLIYAAIFKTTAWSLLPARALSAVSAALAVGIIFSLTSSFFRDRHSLTRLAISGAACLLLITSPLFRYTSGRAWNHDFPTVLTLGAAALLLRTGPETRGTKALLASGMLLGLAIGTRLTYVLALVPFVLVLASRGEMGDRLRRARHAGAFGAGLLVASLPWMALFAAAPRRFIFGILTYQTLNTDYRELLAHRVGETLLGKAVFFYHVLVDDPANLILFLAFGAAAAWIAAKSFRRRIDLPREIVLLGGLALVLLASAFVATPSWYQYFYAPIPFLILTTFFTLSAGWPASPDWGRGLAWTALAVLLACGLSLVSQRDWPALRDTRKWIPVQAHQLGIEIKGSVPFGKVLTLAPIFPLEGGMGIYAPLATGPFSWRVAPLLTQEKRREIGLITYTDLDSLLDADPPAAVLVGFEAGNEGFERGSIGGLEVPLEAFATEHEYAQVNLSSPLTEEVRLWTR